MKTKILKVRAHRLRDGKWLAVVDAAQQTWSCGSFRRQDDARTVARNCARAVGATIGFFFAAGSV